MVAVALVPMATVGAAWLARIVAEGWTAVAWAIPSGRSLPLLASSLLLAATVAAMAGTLGVGLAFWLHQAEGFFARVARRLYLVPLLIPPYMQALAWMAILGRRQALDQAVALVLGPDRVSISGYGFWPSALVLALALFPIVTLLVLAGLRAIEPELVEQACLLRPPWQAARQVVFPLLVPWLVAGVGLVFVLALVEYGVPSSLQFTVYSMELYATFSQDGDSVRATAIAVPLVLAAVVALGASQWRLPGLPLRGQPSRPWRLSWEEWPWQARWIVRLAGPCCLLAAAGPPVVLLARAASPAIFPAAVSAAGRELVLTLGVALATATLSTAAALPAAASLVRRGAGGAAWLLCALPLAVPGPLMGIALIHALNRPWLDWAQSTPLPIVLAHTARLLPFAIFAAATQLRRIDPALMEAASLQAVSPLRRLTWIRLPLAAPAALAAWLIVFLLSLGELGATLLVAPPGQATLPLRVYNLMHYGATETVAALSLLLLAAGGTVGAGAIFVTWRLWPWTR